MDEREQRILRETLAAAAETVGFPLSPAQIDACVGYAGHLLQYNAHTNLTRIIDPAAMAIKHFADSLTVLQADIPIGASLADVGTGAGFPGLVMKIARPDLSVTLIDSLGKRLTFLAEVAAELKLADVSLVHARAEDAGRDPKLRDRFDIVTARAVAALPILLEWCGPLVRPQGRFIAMKTAAVDAELSAAHGAGDILGLVLENDRAIHLPPLPEEGEAGIERRLLVYRKRGPTPALYPRRPAEIKARPLGAQDSVTPRRGSGGDTTRIRRG